MSGAIEETREKWLCPHGCGILIDSPCRDEPRVPAKQSESDAGTGEWRDIPWPECGDYRIENRYGEGEVEHIHPNWACGGLQRRVRPMDALLTDILAEVARQDAEFARGSNPNRPADTGTLAWQVFYAADWIRKALRTSKEGA